MRDKLLKNCMCIIQNLQIQLSLFHGSDNCYYLLRAYYMLGNALDAFVNALMYNVFHNPIK